MKRFSNVDMTSYTSFRAGGRVSELVIVESPEELIDVLREEPRPKILLGNGTNTIFACDEYEGLVVKLGEAFDFIDVSLNEDSDQGIIRVGGATLLSKLAKAAAENSLTGLEFAAGIPGSVGGAVFMNAGAYDGEIKDVLSEVTLCRNDLIIETLSAEDLELSYRHSRLMEIGGIILDATFILRPGEKEAILNKMKDFAGRRSEKQPLEYPSAGSFFKRPPGMFAGKLIEDAGLKGLSVGGAQVSEKHAGFLINKGGATYQDVLDLMGQVRDKVKSEFDVMLEPEVRIITKE